MQNIGLSVFFAFLKIKFHQEFTINYYSCPRAQKHEAGHMGATTTTTSNLSAGEEKKKDLMLEQSGFVLKISEWFIKRYLSE